jgi:hypothetical protein
LRPRPELRDPWRTPEGDLIAGFRAKSGSVIQAMGDGGILVGVIVFMVGSRLRRLALDRRQKLSG